MKPRVDVIIPCYNYGDVLAACVNSVLDQPDVDVRVLLMDDASTDTTEEVGSRLAADPRVEYRRHTINRGHIATYNEALALLTGEFCLLLSADDLLTPGALRRATRVMVAHPQVGLAYGPDITFRHAPPDTTPSMTASCTYRIMSYFEFLERSCRLGHTPIQAPTVVVRTSLHRDIGGYRPELPHTADTEIWLRMAARGTVCELHAPQAFRRLHDRNMSLDYSPVRRLHEQKKAFDTHFDQLQSSHPEIADLQPVMTRTIAEQAFWSASRSFDSGDMATCRCFLAFAADICPDLAASVAWRRFRVKRWLGPAVWRTLRPALARVQALLARRPVLTQQRPRFQVTAADERPAARTLRVVIELNSVDLRIGAVNDALDLAELASPAAVRFLLCGPITDQFRQEAARRGIAAKCATSRMISKRGLALYAIDVCRWIVRLIAWRTDVVHLNYSGYAPSMACAAWICGIPVVARVGPFHPHNLANRWVSAYVANCRAHGAHLLGSMLRDRVIVTGDLFRADRVRQTLVCERPLPPLRDGLVRVVYLGQLVERKGLDVLIAAFARLSAPAELLIAGGDWSAAGYPERLRTLACELGVADRIHFENHRQDVGAVLSTADVFVLPSRSDARPRSIIEAMSLGLPVVATDVGGIPSLVLHEHTGLLVPADDAGALAGALARMIQSRDLRILMGGAGRRYADQVCRPDLTALQYVDLYRRLAGGRSLPGRLPSVVARARS